MEYDQSHAEKEAMDQERWRQGTTSYARFYNTLTPDQRTELHKPPTAVHWRKNPGTLQAMFLGEKPMAFEFYTQPVMAKLAKAGFGVAGPYVYDRGQIMDVLRKNPADFAEFPTQDADIFMHAFATKPYTECHRQRGLLLGFPVAAIDYAESKRDTGQELSNIQLEIDPDRHPRAWVLMMDFRARHLEDRVYWPYQFLRDHLPEIAEEIGMLPTEAIRRQKQAADLSVDSRYNAYGVQWSDAPDSQESAAKVRHLKRAFERSGILRVDRRERVNRGMRSIASVISSRLSRLLGRPKEGSH